MLDLAHDFKFQGAQPFNFLNTDISRGASGDTTDKYYKFAVYVVSADIIDRQEAGVVGFGCHCGRVDVFDSVNSESLVDVVDDEDDEEVIAGLYMPVLHGFGSGTAEARKPRSSAPQARDERYISNGSLPSLFQLRV